MDFNIMLERKMKSIKRMKNKRSLVCMEQIQLNKLDILNILKIAVYYSARLVYWKY